MQTLSKPRNSKQDKYRYSNENENGNGKAIPNNPDDLRPLCGGVLCTFWRLAKGYLLDGGCNIDLCGYLVKE